MKRQSVKVQVNQKNQQVTQEFQTPVFPHLQTFVKQHPQLMQLQPIREIQLSSDGSVIEHQQIQKQQTTETTVDLNKCLFNNLVELCRKQELISDDLAHSFHVNHSFSLDKKYIELYRTNRLKEYSFSKSKINIVDHRRLTSMLVNHSSKFIPLRQPANPYDFLKENQQFLREIYELSESDYNKLIETQVKKYYQTWWGGPQAPLGYHQPSQEVLVKQFPQSDKALSVVSQKSSIDMKVKFSQLLPTPQNLKDIAQMLGRKFYGDAYASEKSQKNAKQEFQAQDEQNVVKKQEKERQRSRDDKIKKDKPRKKKHKKDRKEANSQNQVKVQAQNEQVAKQKI